MMVNLDNLVSITEANQNFSKVARMVDKNGSVVILKNNVPRYLLIEYKRDELTDVSDDEMMAASLKFMTKNKKAYEVLAK